MSVGFKKWTVRVAPSLVGCLRSLTHVALARGRRRGINTRLRSVLACVSVLGRLSASGIRTVDRSFPVAGIFERSRIGPSLSPTRVITGTPRDDSNTFIIPGAIGRWKKHLGKGV